MKSISYAWLVALSGAILSGSAVADDTVPSVAAAEKVFVSGVEESFDAVRAAVERAKAKSGRDYRVVVVDTAGAAGDARGLLDRIVKAWRADEGSGFDPAADAVLVLAVGDRRLAMDVPWALEVGSGLDQGTLERELIQKAFVPRAKDGLYDQGLADLIDATETWVATRADEKQAREEAARTFRTRTLPLGLASMAGAGVLGALALQWTRHGRTLRQAREKLAVFKGDVVALSDLLDSEQERHRMLPHTDPDFQTPMEGQTRAAYDNVQSSIRRYRERWLGLMDVWEKAQQTVDAEWFLGTGKAAEAIRLLDSAEARPPLDAVAGECRGPLDVLEQSHEKARELLATLDTETTQARERLDRLAGRGRSHAVFQPTLADVARVQGQCAAELERDPVAARGRLEAATATLAAAVDRIDGIEAADDRRLRAVEQAATVEADVRRRRAEGWLLAEQGANPDDRVAGARQACDLAGQLLDAGETTAALVHVEQAEKLNAEAAALLESIVAARGRAEELLPTCAARLEALASRRPTTIRALEHLAGSYAESSWADVADNVGRADEGLTRVEQLIHEARAAMEPTRQEYFRAVALLEETVRQEDWIEGCHAAVTDRRAELDELLATLPPRREKAGERVATLERRLHRQQTDRARANERCRESSRLLDVAGSALAVARPDLRQASQLVEAADAAAARAEAFADEDERLASQAADEIEETDALLRRVAAWYAEGVQPDVRGAAAGLETARSLLGRQRYEDAIKAAGEASQAGRAAYAAATAEAERRRIRRLDEIRRRQLEESFTRMSRGAGPWVIQLPGGMFSGPDPWRSLQSGPLSSGPSRTAGGGGWSRDIAQVGW
jgi:uncharacterized membrane protein YgcG